VTFLSGDANSLLCKGLCENEPQNIEQGTAEVPSESKSESLRQRQPRLHFVIRHSLFDILRFAVSSTRFAREKARLEKHVAHGTTAPRQLS
jgi:hypothetical protein